MVRCMMPACWCSCGRSWFRLNSACAWTSWALQLVVSRCLPPPLPAVCRRASPAARSSSWRRASPSSARTRAQQLAFHRHDRVCDRTSLCSCLVCSRFFNLNYGWYVEPREPVLVPCVFTFLKKSELRVVCVTARACVRALCVHVSSLNYGGLRCGVWRAVCCSRPSRRRR